MSHDSHNTQNNAGINSLHINSTQNSQYHPTNVHTVSIGNTVYSQQAHPSTYQGPQNPQVAQMPQSTPQMPGTTNSPNYVYNPAYVIRQAENNDSKVLIKIFAITCGIILIICLCSVVCFVIYALSLETPSTVGSTNTSITQTTPTPKSTNQAGSVSVTPTPKSQPPVQSTYKVGEKILIDDLEITVEEVKDDVIAKFPVEGKKYIAVFIYAKNNGTKSVSVNSSDFKLKTSDNTQYSPSVVEKTEPNFGYASIDPNTAVRGWVTYEIPQEAKGLSLIYTSNKGSTKITVDLGL
ncbi:MAG: hypothetical protein KatS3mg084_0392 [Candidatus Dojkabacteria bacterium]|nr:MAG: hypothetical protein KatS3mg084_0392 [Candidatus Dojkabacteria bacterium]